jgi:ABC-type glycerol-3-phosphate transport system substrate-binding protein
VSTTSQQKMNRRSFLKAATLSAAAGLLAACAQAAPSEQGGKTETTSQPSGQPKDVNISMWFHDFLYVRFFKNRAFEFEKLHPEYKFTWDAIQVPGSQIADKFISALAAGAGAPDIGGVQNQVLARLFKGQLAEKGLVDLAPKIAAEKDKFVCWEPYTYKGKVYGVASSTANTTYYYRPDLFEKAGVDPKTMETWQDFIDAGTKMKEKGYWMAIFDTTYPEPNLLDPMLTNGGGYYDKDGNMILDSQANLEALQLFVDLIQKHKVVMGTGDFWGPGTTAAIKEDKVAGMIMPDWYLDYVMKNTFPEQLGKWAAMPGFAFKKGGLRSSYTGDTGMSVFQQSKWQDLAFELIQYGYMTTEGQTKRWSEIHYFPTMKEVWQDPRVIEDQDSFLGGQKLAKLWADEAPKLPKFYTGTHRVEMISGLGTDVLVPVIAGQKEPAAALKELADKIKAMPQ